MTNKLRAALSVMLCVMMLISSFTSPTYAVEHNYDHDHVYVTEVISNEVIASEPTVSLAEEGSDSEVQPSTAAPTVVFNGPYVNGNQS